MAASYPTSVKSFTPKVDGAEGDLVAAADINDLQLEVAAIETQLIASGVSGMIIKTGTADVTIASGDRAATSSAVTFATAFTTIVGVFMTVVDAGVLIAAEMPLQVLPVDTLVTGFAIQLSCFANVAADRVVTVRWLAIGT
jgi:hypothetical protein